jgi:hypothetical protein
MGEDTAAAWMHCANIMDQENIVLTGLYRDEQHRTRNNQIQQEQLVAQLVLSKQTLRTYESSMETLITTNRRLVAQHDEDMRSRETCEEREAVCATELEVCSTCLRSHQPIQPGLEAR